MSLFTNVWKLWTCFLSCFHCLRRIASQVDMRNQYRSAKFYFITAFYDFDVCHISITYEYCKAVSLLPLISYFVSLYRCVSAIIIGPVGFTWFLPLMFWRFVKCSLPSGDCGPSFFLFFSYLSFRIFANLTQRDHHWWCKATSLMAPFLDLAFF